MKLVFVMSVFFNLISIVSAVIMPCETVVPRVGILDAEGAFCPLGATDVEAALAEDPSADQYQIMIVDGSISQHSDDGEIELTTGSLEHYGLDYVAFVKAFTTLTGDSKAQVIVQSAYSRNSVAHGSMGFMVSSTGQCGLVRAAATSLWQLMSAIDIYEKTQIARGAPFASSPCIRVSIGRRQMLPGDSVQVKLHAKEARLTDILSGRVLKLKAVGGIVTKDSVVLDNDGNGEVWFKAGMVPGAVTITATLDYLYEPSNKNRSARGWDFANIGPPPNCYEITATIRGSEGSYCDTTKSNTIGPVTFTEKYKTNDLRTFSATLHGWITYWFNDNVLEINTNADQWKALVTGGTIRSSSQVVWSTNPPPDNGWSLNRSSFAVTGSDTAVSLLLEYDTLTKIGMLELNIPMSGTSSSANQEEAYPDEPDGGVVSAFTDYKIFTKTDSGITISHTIDSSYSHKPPVWSYGTVHYVKTLQIDAFLKATILDESTFGTNKRVNPTIGSPLISYSRGILEIRGETILKKGVIEIFDLNGRSIFKISNVSFQKDSQRLTLPIPYLSGGCFIVSVRDNGGHRFRSMFFSSDVVTR